MGNNLKIKELSSETLCFAQGLKTIGASRRWHRDEVWRSNGRSSRSTSLFRLFWAPLAKPMGIETYNYVGLITKRSLQKRQETSEGPLHPEEISLRPA
jgi:hypothetical protein